MPFAAASGGGRRGFFLRRVLEKAPATGEGVIISGRYGYSAALSREACLSYVIEGAEGVVYRTASKQTVEQRHSRSWLCRLQAEMILLMA